MKTGGFFFLVLFTLFLASSASAADFNAYTATPSSFTVNTSVTYNITVNITSWTNISNVSIVFPSSFYLGMASISSDTANFTNGTTVINGPQLIFNLNQTSEKGAGTNFTLLVANVYNPSVAANYSIATTTYNSTNTSIITAMDNGSASVIMTAGAIEKANMSSIYPVTTSGGSYTIVLTGLDRYGNANNSGGFNVSSSNTSVSANTTAGPTSFTFNALLAGNNATNLTFLSISNTSVLNWTLATVLAADIQRIELSPLFPVATSGNTYAITVTGRDLNGNANNSGGFAVTTSNSSVSSLVSNTTSTFTFNALLAGNTTLFFTSLGNSSVAANLTNSSVLIGSIHSIALSSLFPVTTSGNTYAITITGYDINKNINNTGGFNVSIGNSTVTTLASNTSTTFTFNAVTVGTTNLTFLSLYNTSASNVTDTTVTGDAIVRIELSPLFPATTSGNTYTITVTGRDANGNANNGGGFSISSSNSSVSALISNTSNVFTLSTLLAGNTTLNFTSLVNSSASNSTNSSVLIGAISRLVLSQFNPSVDSGNTLAITVTGYDGAGNINNSGGFNVSIGNSSVTSNTTGSPSFTFSAVSSGTTTLQFNAYLNASATNTTNYTVVSGPIARIEMAPLFPVNVSGGSFRFTLTGRDANANVNNTGGFIFSVGNSSILVLGANTSTTANYTGVVNGNSSFTATSALNSSVSNSTNASVTIGVVTQIRLTPQAPSLTVGDNQQFTANAVDANGNINTTVTITWAIVNLTADASINSSGFLTNNSNAGIVTVNASYATIVNLTNATYSVAATPTPTPSTGGSVIGSNPGSAPAPSEVPTPSAIPSATPEPIPSVPKTVIVDDHTAVTGTFTPTSGKVEIVFSGGRSGFVGSVQYNLPLDYDDYVDGIIVITPKPKSVRRGSVIVEWDVNLKPNEDFQAILTVSKPIAPSILNEIQPPVTKLAQPSGGPAATYTPTPSGQYAPPEPRATATDYTGYLILLIALVLLGAYLYSMKTEEKRKQLER